MISKLIIFKVYLVSGWKIKLHMFLSVFGDALSVMVIVIGNVDGDTS